MAVTKQLAARTFPSSGGSGGPRDPADGTGNRGPLHLHVRPDLSPGMAHPGELRGGFGAMAAGAAPGFSRPTDGGVTPQTQQRCPLLLARGDV
jgi:hypothetical protein